MTQPNPQTLPLRPNRRLVVDSGPLITLALLDRLDLLTAANMEIAIPYTVAVEVLGLDNPELAYDDTISYTYESQRRIAQFIRSNPDSVLLFSTPNYDRLMNGEAPAANNGEQAVLELLQIMYDEGYPGKAMVLYEDGDMERVLGLEALPKVTNVVTSAYVRGMAAAGRLPVPKGHTPEQEAENILTGMKYLQRSNLRHNPKEHATRAVAFLG